MGIGRYIIRRLIQSVPTIFGITLLSYMLMTAAPGGPVAALSFDPSVSPEQRQRLAAQLGVDDPWIVQYIHWLVGDDWRVRDTDGDGEPDFRGTRQGILRGDFGDSFTRSRQPVTKVISELIVPTLELTISALVFGLVLGIPIGILAAISRGGIFDNVTRVLAVIFNAVPNFWLGLILILVFSVVLDWTPISKRCETTLTGGCPPVWERMEYLILPVITLGTVLVAGYSRYMRTAMLDVISQDYMRTARAKGLSSRQVWVKHGARNALIPIATFLGPALTGLLGGAVITEAVFSWPGLGRLTLTAATSQDYPLVMASVLLASLATIIGFILSDILYALIDPRIRF
jgi:peptide/nickel transport system permease protein